MITPDELRHNVRAKYAADLARLEAHTEALMTSHVWPQLADPRDTTKYGTHASVRITVVTDVMNVYIPPNNATEPKTREVRMWGDVETLICHKLTQAGFEVTRSDCKIRRARKRATGTGYNPEAGDMMVFEFCIKVKLI